ncbi:MAG: hypothetical protein JXB25_07510 [Deltaproteobacteria bacterium]|nr:hypothetical protein [Deltaproteobacteria bacterium]
MKGVVGQGEQGIPSWGKMVFWILVATNPGFRSRTTYRPERTDKLWENIDEI